MVEKEYNKVFISYAKEDIESAMKLYAFLKNNNFDVWIDKENILAGQDWDYEIRKALKNADYIILLLSNISVEKRGYVQREFKIALEYVEEKLESDIYIIPCKIDDCEIPEKLKKIQWLELEEEGSYDRLLRSLNNQRITYQNKDFQSFAKKISLDFKEEKIERVIGNGVKSVLNISYIQFNNIKNESLSHLNTYIQADVLKIYNYFLWRDNKLKFNTARRRIDVQISYKIEVLSSEIISYKIYNYSYYGSSQGNYNVYGYNYKLNPLIQVTLNELLNYNDDALSLVTALCEEKLLEKTTIELGIDGLNKESLFVFADKISWETFNNFYVTPESVTIIFNWDQFKYSAFGQQEIEIKYSELINRIPELLFLKDLWKSIIN